MILSGIASLGGVIIKGLNSYLKHKRNAAMSNAVKQLYENDKIFHDKILVTQNKTALLANTQLQQVNNIRENMHKFDKKPMAIKMLAKYFFLHTTNIQKYTDSYRQYAVTLDAFLTALDTLGEGV